MSETFLEKSGRDAKVCILTFSGRRDGNCFEIAKHILSRYPDGRAKLYNFAELDITPCGKCALECFQSREECPYSGDKVYEMYDAVTNSDMTYFIVPNYCDYPCSNYFAFNERSQCYFQGHEELLKKYLEVKKKFVVVSNTGKENFRKAFLYQVNDEEQLQILFLSAKKYHKVSIKGDLMTSEEAVKDLDHFI
ncbi:MAG: hypothetical protein ACI4AD_11475 [Roseburia sp.]